MLESLKSNGSVESDPESGVNVLDLGEYKLLWGVAALDMKGTDSVSTPTGTITLNNIDVASDSVDIDLSDKVQNILFSSVVKDANYTQIMTNAETSLVSTSVYSATWPKESYNILRIIIKRSHVETNYDIYGNIKYIKEIIGGYFNVTWFAIGK